MSKKFDLPPSVMRKLKDMGYEPDELPVLFKSEDDVLKYLTDYAESQKAKAACPADDEEDLTSITLSTDEAGIAEMIRHDEKQNALKPDLKVSVDDMRDVRKLLESLNDDEDETRN